MKLLIDAHYIGARAGGNETHTRNLLAGLREVGCAHDVAVLMDPAHVHDPVAADFRARPLRVHSSYLRVPFVIPYEAMRAKADLLHIQYTAPPWSPLNPRSGA